MDQTSSSHRRISDVQPNQQPDHRLDLILQHITKLSEKTEILQKQNTSLLSQNCTLRLQQQEQQASINNLIEKINATTNQNAEFRVAVTKALWREDQSFYPFKNLPTEIRHMIWDLALLVPQVICCKIENADGLDGSASFDFVAMVPHSPLLKVNQEARCKAQKIQKPLYYGDPEQKCYPLVFFNGAIDTLWIQNFSPTEHCNNSTHKGPFAHLALTTLAIPFQAFRRIIRGQLAWLNNNGIDEVSQESLLVFLVGLCASGVQDVKLVLSGVEDLAASDIVFLRPRGTLRSILKECRPDDLLGLIADDIYDYTNWELQERIDKRILKTSLLDLVNEREISKELDDDVRMDLNIRAQQEYDITKHLLRKAATKTWKLPTFKYYEAISREEHKRFHGLSEK